LQKALILATVSLRISAQPIVGATARRARWVSFRVCCPLRSNKRVRRHANGFLNAPNRECRCRVGARKTAAAHVRGGSTTEAKGQAAMAAFVGAGRAKRPHCHPRDRIDSSRKRHFQAFPTGRHHHRHAPQDFRTQDCSSPAFWRWIVLPVPIPPLCSFCAGFRRSGTVWLPAGAQGRKRKS